MNVKRAYRVTSHETISHDDIENLGYDWDRAANPKMPPKRPLRLYLPETADEIAQVLKEAQLLELKVSIRGKGHSSNNLVLADRDPVVGDRVQRTCVLLTEFLRSADGTDRDKEKVEPVDAASSTVWVWAGARLAAVDAALEEQGYGLPVIGDHNDITAGGFASVGGVSPASNVHGMFIDNVEEIEWVDLNGAIKRCSRSKDPDRFLKLLGGTGQNGVIARLRCKVIQVRKTAMILKNHWQHRCKLEKFLDLSAERIANPQDVKLERGLWLELPVLGNRIFRIGQYSGYHKTPCTRFKSLYDRLIHGFLHGLGRFAGRLPEVLDRIVQVIGLAGVIFSPRYASVKNIESFADRILDTSVGDPHRMLIVFAPVEQYQAIFRELHHLCCEFRTRGFLSFIALYVKGIKSPYLSSAFGKPQERCCEILLYLGITDKMTDQVLEEMVRTIDEICIESGALRYMHTRTVGPRDRIDPNARVAAAKNRREEGIPA